MKVIMEIVRNKKKQSSEIEYNDFNIALITEKIKFPNFHPKLTRFFSEDSGSESCSIINLQYVNQNNPKDQVFVKIVPMFCAMDAVMNRVA